MKIVNRPNKFGVCGMKKRRSFSLEIFARIYAWFQRRRGYETVIEEWEDQFPSGWLWSFGYEVITTG
jgi:hypothetical protein